VLWCQYLGHVILTAMRLRFEHTEIIVPRPCRSCRASRAIFVYSNSDTAGLPAALPPRQNVMPALLDRNNIRVKL